MEIDQMINQVFLLAEAESFGSSDGGRVRIPPVLRRRICQRPMHWTPAERQYLREHIGEMTDEQIGTALGRSSNAVKIKRQRWGMPAHSKRPGWLTGNQAAKLLGIDIHAVMALTERGILPYQRIPGRRGILSIEKTALIRWAVNPLHWIYFRADDVRDRNLRRLLELRRERWQDTWWTPGQAAVYHDVSDSMINHWVRSGKLPAVRWGNWWLLRSDVIRVKMFNGRGHGHELDCWSDDGDAFLVLGAAIGLSLNVLGRMTHYGEKRASYRLRWIMRCPDFSERLAGWELPVKWDPKRKMVYANWRDHLYRFPALDQAMYRFYSFEESCERDILMVRSVLAHQMDWLNLPGPRMVSVFKWSRQVVLDKLYEMARLIEATEEA